MAKGTRSSGMKKLRTWRRENTQASWQAAADQRRYEALTNAAAAPPVEQPKPPKPEEEEQDGEDAAMAPVAKHLRGGRKGKPAKEGAEIGQQEDADKGDAGSVSTSGGKKGRGKGLAGSIQKRKKKAYLSGFKNHFHKQKKKGHR